MVESKDHWSNQKAVQYLYKRTEASDKLLEQLIAFANGVHIDIKEAVNIAVEEHCKETKIINKI